MNQEESIYDWMAKQKFPLDRAGVAKVSAAKISELRAAGIKFVGVLGAGRGDCKYCRAMKNQKIEIELAQPLPLPGCNKKNCLCLYIAVE